MRHLVKVSMLMLAIPAMYFVFSFQLEAVPWYIAVLSAASLVSVYLGLAYVPTQTRQERQFAIGIAGLAMGIEVVYGVLHSIQVVDPSFFTPPLPLWAMVSLGVLHGAPFSLLLFSVSLLVVHSEQQTGQISSDQRVTYMVDQTTRTLEMMQERILTMPTTNHQSGEALQALPKATKPVYQCPGCGSELSSAGAYGAAVKHGYCRHCKPVKKVQE